MKQEIQGKMDKALQSFDGIQRAEANPFLWSKIKTRLQPADAIASQQLAWRMVIALAAIIVVNLFTLFSAGKTDTKTENGAELVAAEYSLNLPQSY